MEKKERQMAVFYFIVLTRHLEAPTNTSFIEKLIYN